MHLTLAKPLVRDDASVHFGDDAVVAGGEALQEDVRLIAQRDEARHILLQGAAHHAGPAQTRARNARHAVEAQKAELADVDRSKRYLPMHLLYDQKWRRTLQLQHAGAQASRRHRTVSEASITTGGMCR